MTAMPSPDLAREQAYLVSRGVRPMALLGTCEPAEREEVWGRLLVAGQHYPEALPFWVAFVEGDVAYGFAAASWCVDLFTWARSQPEAQRERIEGLLLGYGAREIARHEEARSARREGR